MNQSLVHADELCSHTRILYSRWLRTQVSSNVCEFISCYLSPLITSSNRNGRCYLHQKRVLSLTGLRWVKVELTIETYLDDGTDPHPASFKEAFDVLSAYATSSNPSPLHSPNVDLSDELYDKLDELVSSHIDRLWGALAEEYGDAPVQIYEQQWRRYRNASRLIPRLF